MDRITIIKVYFITCYCFIFFAKAQKTIFHELKFGKGATVIYTGSGALSRHLDFTKHKNEVDFYKRTPFISIGIDRCIDPYGSNAYWGLGPYLSSWLFQKKYSDNDNNNKEILVSNSLIAIRLTHHNTYYVRKKLDMCSGILVGARLKYTHIKTVNEIEQNHIKDQIVIQPAIGITATLRYYFYKNIGLYTDLGVGYKTDLVSVGIVYKVK